jgi:hypothetical protein
MDAKAQGEHAHKNNICGLEWIAWAIDAARRHKDERREAPARPRRMTLVRLDFGRR